MIGILFVKLTWWQYNDLPYCRQVLLGWIVSKHLPNLFHKTPYEFHFMQCVLKMLFLNEDL